jgi:hypothetical protein
VTFAYWDCEVLSLTWTWTLIVKYVVATSINAQSRDLHQQKHSQDYGTHEENYNSFLLDNVS